MNPLAEDRLRASLEAEAERVDPSPDSLDVIRTRVRGARRRRRTLLAGTALAAVVVAAVALPRLGDRADDVSTGDRPSTTSPAPTTSPGPTTTTQFPPENGRVPLSSVAIWPAAGAAVYTDPVAATDAFVREVVGVDDAPLSEFHGATADAGAGSVDVHARGEDGRELDRVVATVLLSRDATSWYVLQATSDDVVVGEPNARSTLAPETTVTGRSRGFEGTVVASVATPTAPATPVAQAAAIGGSGEQLERFQIDLVVAQSPGGRAILVTRTDAAIEGGVPAFDARGVTLPAPGAVGGAGGAAGPSVPGAATSDQSLQGQPLWPFATGAEVDVWRSANAEGGHQPWHLDPEETALHFTRDYLGFTELDVVTSRDVLGREAWIGVGSSGAADGGGPFEAAVVHVVRWGAGDDAPWEVVGTRDTDLTLDVPRYGSAVTSPVTVGGTIEGVDESLRVQVRQLSSADPIGESCCVAAGNPRVTWETSVAYEGAIDHTLTIVVSTGGHRQEVERFAVTGVER
jgi:hypothetical protein